MRADLSNVDEVLKRVRGVNGFFAASSIERLPTGIAITNRTRQSKALRGSVGDG